MLPDINCQNVATLLVTLLVVFYAYFKWSYQYWKRKGVPYLEPTIPIGNLHLKFWTTTVIDSLKQHYVTIKSKGYKFCGVYLGLGRALMVTDLELIKHILVKDFNIFVSRGFYYHETADPISAHLFAIDGKKWRNLRTKLTPTFTSGKMKMMFPTLVDCGAPLTDFVGEKAKKNEPVDIKDIFSRFTTNIIGSCAFGIECNCFTDPNSEFAQMGRSFFHRNTFENLKLTFIVNFPTIAKKLGFRMIRKSTSDFYRNVTKSLTEYREKNNVTRKDFMQLLIDLKNTENPELGKLTMDEITAQAFVFFIAGFETSSSSLTFCSFELARNLDIQEKLRQEILNVLRKHDNQITYEAVHDMKYLSQVIDGNFLRASIFSYFYINVYL